MILSPMRFGDYVWPHNPRVYEIEYRRRIVCNRVPFGLYTLTDLGRDQRVLRGEGEFAGEGAYAEFKKLASMFYVREPKVLTHPVWQNALAWMVKLKLRQEPREDYVAYEFEFWECYDGYDLKATEIVKKTESAQTSPSLKRTEYVVKKGDSLWGLAVKNSLALDALLAMNPQIKNPNLIYVGDIVFLS